MIHSSPTTVAAHRIPHLRETSGRYELAFAQSAEELNPVLRLRYEVFNLELEEGLEVSHQTGMDRDAFDDFCHHLIVRDRESGLAVGTYRMQTQEMAASGRDFYAATEFDLAMFPPGVLENSLEIGRACIAREHRNLQVLYLLWRGLGQYLAHNQLRFLFGCCSLTSQDSHEATRVFRRLARDGNLDPKYSIDPLVSHRCLVENPDPGADHVPRLMRAYLGMGAKICSGPAIDREFKTVDYLALFDLSSMPASRLAFFQCE
ncbi:MAG: putative hemolysin [Rhodothermales bacterium]